MSMRYKGSRLSATANTPTSLAASGAWTLQQQMQANGTSTWPFVRDPQFNYVTMLLHGDGSAGANNGSGGGVTPTVTNFNADASTNNFNLTINGDARSNNFNPYQSGYYSNYFDGSGDYLTATMTGGLGSGDFTLELWVYATSVYNYITWAGTTRDANGFSCGTDANGALVWVNGVSGVARTWDGATTAGNIIRINSWNHVAFVRSSGTMRVYLNGVATTTATGASSVSDTANYSNTNLSIGKLVGGGEYPTGYLSNLRIVNGTAVYTGAFTPPTTPLTAITNTKFLTCQSNRFIDTSSNAFAITVAGDTSVSFFQPFTLPSSVATYGSGYFDGTGDFLSAPASTSWQLTGDYTIEAWVYLTSLASNGTIYATGGSGAADQFTYTTSGELYFGNQGTGTGVITTNRWLHVAASRSGTTQRIFVSGVLQATATVTGTIGQNLTAYIGQRAGADNLVTGYISDLRLVKGTAVYTAAFTPPTSPLTAITNTQLLTTQYNGGGNNSGFKDSGPFNFPITRYGNATQGTFTPYGANWSSYLGTNGNYFTSGTSAALGLSTGDWTIEFFLNVTQFVDNQFLIDFRPSGSGGATQPLIYLTTAGTLLYFTTSATRITSSTGVITAGTWAHIAVSRVSGSTRMFVNGAQTGSTYTDSNDYGSSARFVNGTYGDAPGATNNNGGVISGYISNLRILKGTGLYTGSYTVPTSPLTAITNTSCLTFQSNRFVDNSSNSIAITPTGSPSVQRFSPFANATAYNPATTGGSAYFDGSGDYLVTSGTGGFNPRSTFTVEFWTYPLTSVDAVDFFNSSTNNLFYIESYNGSIFIGDGTVNTIGGIPPPQINRWTHLLLSFDGTSYRLFYNGVLQATSTTLLLSNTITSFRIGQKNDGTRDFAGYMCDNRVLVGTALYTSAFTPPTAPLTPTPNTSLLLNYTNSAILDQSMMNDLQTVGNAQISTSVVKYGTASMYFDGSGDYLRPNSQLPFVFNTGDFTIEFWVYANSVSGWLTFFDNRPSTTGSGFFLGYNGGFQYYSGSSNLIGGGTLSTSTWTHVALCRSSGSVRIFVNGTQVGSTATDTSNYNASTVLANGPFIGSNYVPSDFLNGYLDDFRVTKYARYTTTFTPPTQALPNG